jgi:hypothetical protein
MGLKIDQNVTIHANACFGTILALNWLNLRVCLYVSAGEIGLR